MYILIGCLLCRRPLRPKSPKISSLELGFAEDRCRLARMGITAGSILEALGSLESLLAWLWYHLGSAWVASSKISYLAFLCGQEHQFLEIRWILGAESLESCGSLWRPSGAPSREDKMIRFLDFSSLVPRSLIPARWVPGG